MSTMPKKQKRESTIYEDAQKERADLPHYKDIDEFLNKYNVDDEGNYTHPSMKDQVEESKERTEQLRKDNENRKKKLQRT
jgi:hypothetical protein